MDADIFLARLNTMLSRQRSNILDQELESDFAILKRQREGESLPPKLYWALKSFPKEYQISYIKCLAGVKDDNCGTIKERVFSREQQTANLVLMEWAERPSTNAPAELLKKWHDAAVEYNKKVGYYSGQVKSLCKKALVQRAFRDCYQKVTGRRMRPVGDSVFADGDSIVIGDARTVVQWDCGGWSHFREEIGVE